MLYKLSNGRELAKLLEAFFPAGPDELPQLSDVESRASALRALALCYRLCGRPCDSVKLLHRHNAIRSEQRNLSELTAGLRDLSGSLFLTGDLYGSEAAGRRSLCVARQEYNLAHEALSLCTLSLVWGATGVWSNGVLALERVLRIGESERLSRINAVANLALAQIFLWRGDAQDCKRCAAIAEELGGIEAIERDLIRAARLSGMASLELGELDAADRLLHGALVRARNASLIEEELGALIALAKLERCRGNLHQAKNLVEDVWPSAGAAPFPIVHSDALNSLAQIERELGNTDRAIAAARGAYRASWCNGTPFSYQYGLDVARSLLSELGDTAVFWLLEFDKSTREPLQYVDVDPPDRFGRVGDPYHGIRGSWT